MPPDKVKLSPESVRTFLEIGLEHAVNKQGSASNEEFKSQMYNFFKMLCVKKSYLYCSYPIEPAFYRLSLHFAEDTGSIFVLLATKNYNFSGKIIVLLNYDAVYKLVKLLLPFLICVYFVETLTDASVFEQYLEILKLTKGRIGFKLDCNLKKQFVQTLLESFADCIYGLICYIEQLETVEFLQFPVFDHLYVRSIENSSQLLRVLGYKAEEFNLYFTTENFTIDDSDLVKLKNESVKILYLDFGIVNYFEIERLVKQLHKCCSRLKHFHFKAVLCHQDEFPANQILDHVVAYAKRIDDLKACFGNALESMSIGFDVLIHINDERDNTWIKRVCENSEFKRWKFKSVEKVVNMDGEAFDEENPVNPEYLDALEMKLDDERCKFGMAINVFTPIEDEDQALINFGE